MAVSDLTVRLIRGDGSEEFILRANEVDSEISRNVVVKGLEGAIGDLVGGTPRVDRKVYTVSGEIPPGSTEASQYPNSAQYNGNDALGMKEELDRASVEWDPISIGYKRDTLQYDDADGVDVSKTQAKGFLSKFGWNENTESRKPRHYTYRIEFSQLDIYVEQSQGN